MKSYLELELVFGRGCHAVKIADAVMEDDEDCTLDQDGETLTPFDKEYWEGVPV